MNLPHSDAIVGATRLTTLLEVFLFIALAPSRRRGAGPAHTRNRGLFAAVSPLSFILPLLALLCVAPARAQQVLGTWQYAFSEYGDIKYPKGFDHYDYVNPNAPKGGSMTLANPDRRTSFDKYNMFTLPQNAPGGVEMFMFEPLCDWSEDELATMYGLVAKEMLVAPDFSAITFRIDERARFNNGDPVTAEDVKYSFDMQAGDKAGPFWSLYFSGVKDAVILDGRTVRFDMKVPSRDQIYQLGVRLRVFSRKWGLGPDGQPLPFDQIVHQEPITTGAYRIYKADPRTLDLVLRPDYWARDIGVRKGFYNFEHLVYHYYVDNAARFEAFKAGDVELLKEYRPSRWVRMYTGPKFADGRIVKGRFKDGMGFFYEGFMFNSRRPQLSDVRVREALSDAFDWKWSSKQGFDLDSRFTGLFENSVFHASGSPTPQELALMEPYRKDIPAAAFGPFPQEPSSATAADLRANLLHARALLAEAGWTLAADGKLRNAQGEPFTLQILDADLEFGPIAGRWMASLEKLGITVDERLVDYAIYDKKMEAFDFDVTLLNYGYITMPSATYLADWMGSAAAKVAGSNNETGTVNPAIDHALEVMGQAKTLDELTTAAHVLDRVFTAEHYGVPYIYRPFLMTGYWDRFGIPDKTPKFYSIEDGTDSIAWPPSTWWAKNLK